MRSKITWILAFLTALLAAASIITYLSSDREAPKITVPSANLTYTEGDSTSGLLTGVRAVDNVDGDLSAKVRIYNIVKMENGSQAQVTYAVYDSSYNLGKATKVVAYTEKKDTKKDTAETAKEEGSVTPVEATTEAVKQEEELTGEGYEDPVLISRGAPVLKLTTHKVEIPVGGYFYSMDYVETAVDDVDSLEYLYAHMYLEGDKYDVNTPGKYELQYYCTDSSGNISNIAKLMLVVGDVQ